jgi:hypothetical protein
MTETPTPPPPVVQLPLPPPPQKGPSRGGLIFGWVVLIAFLAFIVVAGFGAMAISQRLGEVVREGEKSSGTTTVVSDFDLEVGGRSYPIRGGRSVTITTPSGEKVPVTLGIRETQTWRGMGVEFSYPSSFKMTKETDRAGQPLQLPDGHGEPRRGLAEGPQEADGRGGRQGSF